MRTEIASGMRKLGIIAGAGSLPAQLVEACVRQSRPYVILGITGHADTEWLAAHPHHLVQLGAVGESLKLLRKEGAEDVILAGRVGRPSLSSLRPDIATSKFIARFGRQVFNGDDALLSAVVEFLESEGFRVVGASDVLADLIAAAGVLGRMKPSAKDKDDMAAALKVAHILGALDIGQSVVIEDGYVLAVEAAEGTDALLARCRGLKKLPGQAGLLMKAKKPAQTSRADLPTIGKDTVENAYRAGLAGIAVEASGSIILDMPEALALADRYGMFVVGYPYE